MVPLAKAANKSGTEEEPSQTKNQPFFCHFLQCCPTSSYPELAMYIQF